MKKGEPQRKSVARLSLLVVRILVGGIFLWGSIHKLRFPYEFLDTVYAYETVGAKGTMILAMVLPWLELMVGLLLLAGAVLGGALLTSMLLLTTFVIAQCSVIYRGLEISCGCFSADGGATVTYMTVVRTGALLAATVIGYMVVVGTKPSPVVDVRSIVTD